MLLDNLEVIVAGSEERGNNACTALLVRASIMNLHYHTLHG